MWLQCFFLQWISFGWGCNVSSSLKYVFKFLRQAKNMFPSIYLIVFCFKTIFLDREPDELTLSSFEDLEILRMEPKRQQTDINESINAFVAFQTCSLTSFYSFPINNKRLKYEQTDRKLLFCISTSRSLESVLIKLVIYENTLFYSIIQY